MMEGSGMKLIVRPLTPDLWPALEDLFGAHGACNGCWCMYWRIGAAYRKRPREKNKAAFRRHGVTAALIAAALKAARRAKAPALEAYPLDADETPSASFTGFVSTFARAGFQVAARRTAPRPIMRHDLKTITRTQP
jgi:GNAT superfamily N-acetyltransferase